MCAPCAWNGSTVPCGDAGVEEIIGLPFPWGWREWYGCAFGFPGRHPTVLDCGAVPMPMRGARGTPSAGPAGARGAWRFENWKVDASKRNMVFLFAYRDFARLRSEFGFEIDRFVIILTVR